MKTDKNRLWVILAIFVTVVIVLAGGKKVLNVASAAFPKSHEVNKLNIKELVDSAVIKITSGDFDGAEELVSKAQGDSQQAKQLARIINQYKTFADERRQAKAETYKKMLAKLKGEDSEDKNKTQGTEEKAKEDGDTKESDVTEEPKTIFDADIEEDEDIDPEVKKMSETFLQVLRVKEYANEEQEKELLESEVVKSLVEKALKKAEEFESKGKWVDAYAHSYYWLNNLFPDNKQYEEQAEKLTRLAMIEMSIKDNSCETSKDRHQGIKPEMLVRAVRALDFSYVSLVDYKDMATRGVEQCIYLGQVISAEKEDVPYRASVEALNKWQQGLDKIKNELKADLESPKAVERDDFVRIYADVLALNKLTIDLPQEIVVAQFAEASLEALDPFTNLIWPWKVLDFQKNMTQDFTGIGIHITKIRGVLAVASLLPDTPAYHSNLDANDEILAVNGEPTEDMSLTCVVSKITGPKGTKVTLTVRHEDAPEGETEDVTLVRDRIVVPTIRGWVRDPDSGGETINGNGERISRKENSGKWGHMIDPVNKIGYIRLTAFTENTAPTMEKQLENLEKRGMKGLIIDLRDNSGGYLSTASAVVDMFVESGLIVKSQPRWGIANYERANKKGTHPDYPLIILINGSSASASEIVAGALQDPKFNRATLVGTRSYGKGSVQTIVPYSGDGSQLKYTMAYYHLPSNQRVKNRYEMEKQGREDWGIAPDIKLEMTSEEIKKHREVQWSNDVLAQAGHVDKDGKPVKRYTAEETIEADPQLRVALIVAKAKIIKSGGFVKFKNETNKSIADK